MEEGQVLSAARVAARRSWICRRWACHSAAARPSGRNVACRHPQLLENLGLAENQAADFQLDRSRWAGEAADRVLEREIEPGQLVSKMILDAGVGLTAHGSVSASASKA